MPFPTDAARATTDTGGSDTSSPAFSVPTPVENGDLLLLAWRSGGAVNSVTNHAGFNQLVLSSADGTDDDFYVGWRRAGGSEGATLTQTVQTGRRFAGVMWRIQNGGTPIISSVATGSGTSVDPPLLDPAGAAADFLWIAIGGCEDNRTASSAPTNYSNLAFENVSSSFDGASCMGATRELNADSENPGGFTITVTSNNHMTATVAIPYVETNFGIRSPGLDFDYSRR